MVNYKVTKIYYLYWIHSKSTSNMLTEGYIGVTHRPDSRMTKHMAYHTGSRSEYDSNVSRELSKLPKEGIVMDVLYSGSKTEMYQLELKYRPSEYIGWNITKGGGRTCIAKSGWTHTQEAKDKISKAHLGSKRSKPNKYKGKPRWDDNMKKHIGSFHKGKVISDKHKATISEFVKLNSPNNKQTVLHNSIHNMNCVFRSVAEASRMTGIPYSSLRHCVSKAKTLPIMGIWHVV